MIVGIGVDVVDLARFDRAATRAPRLLSRLFADSERTSAGRELGLHSLAGRFAAKEALIKALGGSTGVRWHDIAIVTDVEGRPSFELAGGAATLATQRRASALHLSITHDGGVAIAFVVAETASAAVA